jgi:hypothetical protein
MRRDVAAILRHSSFSLLFRSLFAFLPALALIIAFQGLDPFPFFC